MGLTSLSCAVIFLSLGSASLSAATLEPTFDGIRKTIEDFEAVNPGKTMTIPMVLENLPPNFRSGFTLMYTSRSIQRASYEAPRVIMFGDDARTVMTFNGRPDQTGYERLEFASVNPVTEKLEFRSMTFPASNSGKVAFSEVNPKLCLGCHGSTPHYIWGYYAKWPGAYGSEDDALAVDENGKEQSEFKKFIASAPQDPRYRNLVREFANVSSEAPYRQYTSGDPKSRGNYQLALEARPNARLSMLLLRHQARSRIREIADSSEFSKLKYAFAFYLGGCETQVSSDPLAHKTNLSGLESVAIKLGSSPRKSWHFELSPEVPKFIPYYSGFWTFENLMSFYLWDSVLSKDADLKRYFKPLPFASQLNKVKYPLALTERGKGFWQTLDNEGLGIDYLVGSRELKGFVSPGSDGNASAALCQKLIQKQMSL